MPHKNRSKTFWKKVRSKYKLSFFNENTLEEVWTFRLSRLGAFLFFLLLFITIFLATSYLIVGTPIKTLLPGYLKTEARIKAVDNALRIDSLMKAVQVKDAYLRNLNNILTGNINIDSTRQVNDSLFIIPIDSLSDQKSKATESFIQKYEEEEKYTLNVFNHTIPTEGFVFFSPVKGEIKKKFNPEKQHFGIDILPARNSAVAASLDGTVISANYTIEYGYVIELQHSNNFISVYKYNSELLKKVGEKVSGGEKIAIAGKEANSDKPMVEFQLWYMGKPLNPEEYILF